MSQIKRVWHLVQEGYSKEEAYAIVEEEIKYSLPLHKKISNIVNNKFLNELFTAKDYINTAQSSEIFELSVLIATNNYKNKINIDLNFNFVCKVCKNTHPIYSARCPHCTSILSFDVKQSLAKDFYEKNSSLQ